MAEGQQQGWPPDFRGWIPGFPGFGAVIAHANNAVVTLTCPAAYPDGLRLDLTLLVAARSPSHEWDLRFEPSHPDWLSLSLSWPDGSSAKWGTSHGSPIRDGSSDYTLGCFASDGGPDGIRWQLWLQPLPPAGTALATVEGEDLDHVYSCALDLTEAIAAANQATLWTDDGG